MSPVRIASKPMALRDTAADTISGSLVERVTPELDEKIGGLPSDREFVAMRAAYQATRWHRARGRSRPLAGGSPTR